MGLVSRRVWGTLCVWCVWCVVYVCVVLCVCMSWTICVQFIDAVIQPVLHTVNETTKSLISMKYRYVGYTIIYV